MTRKSHSVGRYALNIDGKSAGYLKSFELGAFEGEVASTTMAIDNFQSKQVTNFKYGDCNFSIGLAQSQVATNWIKAALDKAGQLKEMEVLLGDYDGNVMNSVELYDCTIKEVGFGKLEGSGKESIFAEVKVTPARMRFGAGSGKISGTISAKQKQFSNNNFKVTLTGGVSKGIPLHRVKEVTLPKLTAKSQLDAVGHLNEFTNHYTAMEYGDLEIKLAVADALEVQKTCADWFVGGKRQCVDEMVAAIEFLDPAMKTVATLVCEGVGIKKFSIDKFTAGEDKMSACTLSLYVERMKLESIDNE